MGTAKPPGQVFKTFTADAQAYVYSAWTNQIARVSQDLYVRLRDSQDTATRHQTAVRLGLAPERSITLQVFPDEMIDRALAGLQTNGPEHLVLTVTEACNFRCRYCAYSGSSPYARHHSRTHMTEGTALQALRWYFRFPRRCFHVGFYGGEPLLRRKFLEKLTTAAKAMLPAGSSLSFGMTTNGSLLDDAASQFLAENQVDVFISLDGPATVHDRYRLTASGRPTFARVWGAIQRLRTQYPEYYDGHANFSITLAPPDTLAEIEAFMEAHPEVFSGKVPIVGTPNVALSRLQENLGIRPTERRLDFSHQRGRYLDCRVAGQKADGLSQAIAEAPMRKIHRRAMGAQDPLQTAAGQCAPGTRCHVTPDGKLHMCEHGETHFPIGNVDSGFDLVVIRELLVRFRSLVEPRCRSCWAVRLCAKCIPQLAAGSTLSVEAFALVCEGRQGAIERDLVDYCSARARSNRCFDPLLPPGDLTGRLP